MIRMLIGKVEKLMDVSVSTDVVYFSIPQMLENLESSDKSKYPVAFPLAKSLVSPEIGDEIMIFQPDSEIDLFYYTFSSSTKGSNSLELRSGNTRIGIDITKVEGDDSKNWTHEIELNCDNKSKIKLTQDGINLNADKPINISSTDSINIKDYSSLSIASQGKDVNITDSEIKVGSLNNVKIDNTGITLSDASGAAITLGLKAISKNGFCAIPMCPMSGLPHCTNRSS